MIRRYGWIALLVLAADQAVKYLSCRLQASFTLIPGVLAFTYAENTGMAFSLLSGRSWLLGLISAAVIVLGLLALRRYRLGPLPSVAAMLMLCFFVCTIYFLLKYNKEDVQPNETDETEVEETEAEEDIADSENV